jgi:hypothetical protein
VLEATKAGLLEVKKDLQKQQGRELMTQQETDKNIPQGRRDEK